MQNMNFNYYAFLGIDERSSQEEIKKKLRKTMLLLHPDKSKRWADTDTLRAGCKEILEVCQVIQKTLTTPALKQNYDRTKPPYPQVGPLYQHLVHLKRTRKIKRSNSPKNKETTLQDAELVEAFHKVQEQVEQLKSEKSELQSKNKVHEQEQKTSQVTIAELRSTLATKQKEAAVVSEELNQLKIASTKLVQQDLVNQQLQASVHQAEEQIASLKKKEAYLEKLLNVRKKTISYQAKALKCDESFKGEDIPKIQTVYKLVSSKEQTPCFDTVKFGFATPEDAKLFVDKFNERKAQVIKNFGDNIPPPTMAPILNQIGLLRDHRLPAIVDINFRGSLFVYELLNQIYRDEALKPYEGTYILFILSEIFNINNVLDVFIDSADFSEHLIGKEYVRKITVINPASLDPKLQEEKTIADLILLIDYIKMQNPTSSHFSNYIIDHVREEAIEIKLEVPLDQPLKQLSDENQALKTTNASLDKIILSLQDNIKKLEETIELLRASHSELKHQREANRLLQKNIKLLQAQFQSSEAYNDVLLSQKETLADKITSLESTISSLEEELRQKNQKTETQNLSEHPQDETNSEIRSASSSFFGRF